MFMLIIDGFEEVGRLEVSALRQFVVGFGIKMTKMSLFEILGNVRYILVETVN
jgi:hypothetical protein